MVVAIGRVLLAAIALAALPSCAGAATDVPARSADLGTPSSPAPSPVASVVAAPPSPPDVRVDTENRVSATQTGPGAYRYTVQVPQVVGVGLHEQALDSLIRATLQRDVDAFLVAAQDAQTPTELTCVSRTVRVTARLAVFRVDCTSTQPDGERPATVTHTFNCDLTTARLLALQDLFSPGSAYLDVLSNAARTQFPPQATPVADRSVLEGTAPAAANFRAFLLDQAAMVILFPGFQSSPGAATTPQISVSYDDLQRYFAPGIARLLTG